MAMTPREGGNDLLKNAKLSARAGAINLAVNLGGGNLKAAKAGRRLFRKLKVCDKQLAAVVVGAVAGPHQLLAVGGEDRQDVGAFAVGDPSDRARGNLAVRLF